MERTLERRRLPPLNALRAFEAAARHLNFSRAAEELSVTPGAVSQQIQNLEDYVGAALFKRTPKGLLLTDAAQTALPALREAFDRLAEAASMLTAAVDGRRLTLTAAPSFAAKWLVPRLGRFEELHPQVDVWLSAGLELVDLTAGEVDVAIRYGAGRYPGLEVRRLIGETVIPVLSPELAETTPLNDPADLANHVLLHDGSPEPDEVGCGPGAGAVGCGREAGELDGGGWACADRSGLTTAAEATAIARKTAARPMRIVRGAYGRARPTTRPQALREAGEQLPGAHPGGRAAEAPVG